MKTFLIRVIQIATLLSFFYDFTILSNIVYGLYWVFTLISLVFFVFYCLDEEVEMFVEASYVFNPSVIFNLTVNACIALGFLATGNIVLGNLMLLLTIFWMGVYHIAQQI